MGESRGRLKFVVAAVVALLMLGAGLALGAEQKQLRPEKKEKKAIDPKAFSAEPPQPSGPELRGMRTATSKTFLLPNGGRETIIYEAPIHYRSGGEWKPIEEGFEPTADGALSNGANGFDVELPPRLDAGEVRVSGEGGWISQRLVSEETGAPELGANGTATYETGDASFTFSTLGNGVKEDIELAAPSAPSSFRFELSASPGLTPSLAEDGSIAFSERGGEVVASLPAPVVADASGAAPTSAPIRYLLQEAGSKWLLTIELDRSWLQQPERQWPVTIDPTLELASPTLDCTFGGKTGQAGWRQCGASGFTTLTAKYQQNLTQANDEWSRVALRFNPSAIPTNAYVDNATLGIHAPEAAQNTSGLEANRGRNLWTSNLNWKTYDGVNAWGNNTEGGYMYLDEWKIQTSERGSQAGWWTFPNVTTAAHGWVMNPSVNSGLILKLIDDKTRACTESSCPTRRITFDSSASPDTSKRPYMHIKWYVAAPSTSVLTAPTQGAKSARRFPLESAWSVAGVTGVTYQYKMAPAGSWVTIPAGAVHDANAKSVTWPVPVEGKKSPTLYLDASQIPQVKEYWEIGEISEFYVRALFEGPTGVAGYSKGVNLTADPQSGNPRDATAPVGPGTVDLMTGNFSVSAVDVSIETPGATLEFGRSHSSLPWSSTTGVLGHGWTPNTVVEATSTAMWRSASEVNLEEGISYMVVKTAQGGEVPFEKTGENSFASPPEVPGLALARVSATQLALTDPNGVRTLFEKNPSGNDYLPVSVTTPGTSLNKTQMVYELSGSNRRLKMMIAPSAAGVTCTETNATTQLGCRSLIFTYQPATTWGASTGSGDRLSKITFAGPSSASTMGQWEVSRYAYDANGQLTEQWDPRISPTLKTTYTYTHNGGPIKTLTQPGQETWTMEYSKAWYEWAPGWWAIEKHPERLIGVSRPSLLQHEPTAKVTIAYEVPVSGAGAPYDMSPGAVAKWGQQDLPLDATAVFPPDQVPSSSPPSDYSRAVLYYMDAEGQLVNTATPSGAGTAAASIKTTETDRFGGVYRELTAQNRLRALAAGAESVKRSIELDTHRVFSADGSEMQEEWGPLHQVRLQNGTVTQARLHKTIQYDEGAPAPPAGTPMPHLPTRETTGASIPGQGVDADQRVVESRYDWTLRKLTESIVDPGGLNIRTVTVYDSASGLPTEIRQPSNTAGGTAGTTKIQYYIGTGGQGECTSDAWANLPCKVMPAAQPGTAGQPQLVVERVPSYNYLGEPTEILESPGGGAENTRKTILTYDTAGRTVTQKTEGGGVAVPKGETLYSPTNGLPTVQRLVCETSCTAGGASYSSSFGSSGAGNGQFAHPAGVAVDTSGNLWVADQGNYRVQKFNAKGEYVSSFGSQGSGDGQFARPTDVAIDAAGNLWVTDAANNRIQKFNSKGEFLAKFGSFGTGNGQFNGPESIAIDGKGNIWVGDTYNARVQKFNAAFEFIAKYGSYGSGQGQLVEPTGIDIGPGNNVWIADWGNNRVTVFNEAGEFVRQFGTEGSGNGQFKRPDVIEVDDQGNVWVGDQNNSRIQQFNQTGQYVAQFGTAGSGAGQFSFGWPMGLATDSKGSIWVSDTGNNRVQKWTISSGFDNQEVKTTYDTLGRVIQYEDADGNVSTNTYDLLGRQKVFSDGKGTQTLSYDATSGLPVKLEDSSAGTFTAGYDADGKLVERGLPNGLVAKTTFNEVGSPTQLSYVKSGCATNCTWLDFTAERSIHGQILNQGSLLSGQQFDYDKAGRLTFVKDTPTGGSCTTRSYSYDKDSNRTALVTRAPGLGGVCDTTSTGNVQTYQYDAADRLLATGIVYDGFGRITTLPGSHAGGSTLTTSYFSNDMVATQTQGGVSNAFQLDAALRQRQRIQNGGLEGTEVFHYSDESDSPSWTERGGIWTRNVIGIDGELAAVEDSQKGTALQLTNLHGDVVATASLSTSATGPTATYEYDEFGNPKQAGPARYGWLGGKSRRTELPSGVIQMGARSYVPSIGRFLSVDPVRGGSDSAYDYAGADPVNSYDLDGMRKRRHAQAGLGGARAVPARRVALILPVACASCSVAKGIAELVKITWEKIRPLVADHMEKIAAAIGGVAAAVFERAVRYALNAAKGGARTLESLKGWVRREYARNLPNLIGCAAAAWQGVLRSPPHWATKLLAAGVGCREGWKAAR